MSFHIGDKVVYPNHGVGIIEQIQISAGVGSTQQCYLLRIVSSSLRVMIPLSNVQAVGLRRIIQSKEVNRILRYLAYGECLPAPDWKDRFRDNSEKMRSGSLLQVAEVLKCLLLVSRDKSLSFRERKMLDRARYLLVSELAIVKKTSESHIEALLTRALAKAQLALAVE
jgi:CarD family transcriptional regulator